MLLDGDKVENRNQVVAPSGDRKTLRIVLSLIIGIPTLAFIILYSAYPSIFTKHFPGVRLFLVPSNSMAPTITEGDHVWVNFLTYDRSEPQVGDVVMFTTTMNGQPFNGLKRIAAVGGDEIKIEDGQIFVNGKIFSEPHLDEPPNWMLYYGPLRIPAGKYFVLGDNRNNSYDSRTHGPIDRSQILGKMIKVARSRNSSK